MTMVTLLGLVVGLSAPATTLLDDEPELDPETLACAVECAALDRDADRSTCRLQCGVEPGEIDAILLDRLDVCYDGCRDEPNETNQATCRLQCASDFYARLH